MICRTLGSIPETGMDPTTPGPWHDRRGTASLHHTRCVIQNSCFTPGRSGPIDDNRTPYIMLSGQRMRLQPATPSNYNEFDFIRLEQNMTISYYASFFVLVRRSHPTTRVSPWLCRVSSQFVQTIGDHLSHNKAKGGCYFPRKVCGTVPRTWMLSYDVRTIMLHSTYGVETCWTTISMDRDAWLHRF